MNIGGIHRTPCWSCAWEWDCKRRFLKPDRTCEYFQTFEEATSTVHGMHQESD